MGGKLLAWRWGLGQTNTVKKERKSSVNKSGKFRKVRFLDTSGDNSGGSGGGGVVNDKEQKRVWFSRLWFSIRRKQNKRKGSSTDTNGITNPVTSSALADIQCKFYQDGVIFYSVTKNITLLINSLVNLTDSSV